MFMHLRTEIILFQQANLIAPRTLDLTSVRLTIEASAVLADVLSIEWGLRKLILRDCDLDEAVSLSSILIFTIYN